MRHLHFADEAGAVSQRPVIHDHGAGEYHDHPNMTVAFYSFNEPEEQT